MFHKLKRISLSVCCLFLVVTQGIGVKAGNGSVDASITSSGFNNPISINDVYLTDTQGEVLSSNVLVPLSTSYRINVLLQDLDGLKDINLRVGLIHAPDDSPQSMIESVIVPEALYNQTDLSAENFIFDWSIHNGVISRATLDTATDVLPEESTWVIEEDTNNPLPSDLETTLSFDFTASKAASADDDWYLVVEVSDTLENATSHFYVYTQPISIAWYGEVVVAEGAKVAWDGLEHDADYSTTEETVSINYISNGVHESYVKADAEWTGHTTVKFLGNDFNATLVEPNLEPLYAQEFSLKANTLSSPETATRLSALNDTKIHSNLLRTGEKGINQLFYLYLKLSGEFQNGDYDGTLHFGITRDINE